MATEAYPHEFECDALLADGTTVAVRPIRPDDGVALDLFHEHLSSETVYRRFFSAHPHLRAEEIERFSRVDYRRRMALIAERDGRLVGVARYDAYPDNRSAEVAFVVADAIQGHGLGTLLLEHLAAAARHRGIEAFAAETLATNSQMQAVFRQAGFHREVGWAGGVVRVKFPIRPTQAYLDAVLDRHFSSVAASLRGLGVEVGTGGVGVVCSSRPPAAWIRAAAAGGLGLSAVLAAEDPGAGLAGFSGDEKTVAVVVDMSGLGAPRRFVAIARAVARHKAVVAFDPGGRFAALCEQAGIGRSDRDLLDAARLSLSVPTGHDRGVLPAIADCRASEARTLLDSVRKHQNALDGLMELDTATTGSLLAAYDAPLSAAAELDVGDVSGTLSVRSAAGVSRVLPLTDRDAQDVGGDSAAAVLRVAQLVDDQPDLRRVVIGPRAPRAWVGPPRGNQDDPFVRRLAEGKRPVQPEGRF